MIDLRYVLSKLKLADFFTKEQNRAQHRLPFQTSVFDPP